MKTLRVIVANMLAVLLGAWLLSGIHIDTSWWNVVIVAIVIALMNAIVRPILIFLTIPATIITLGLFLLVINAGTLMLADWILDGFRIDGFWWALLLSFIISFVTSFFARAEKKHGKEYR